MADYTYSKDGLGRILPQNAVEVAWEDQEPLITPERLCQLHLFGIPLISALRNPVTMRQDVMTPDLIKEYIHQAVALCEAEGKFSIFPKQHKEKLPFDRVQYQSFGYFQLRNRPINSIEQLTVTSSNEQTIYQIPLEWVDIGHLHNGQINILPLTMSVRDGQVAPMLAGPGGSAMLNLFSSSHWLASFWECLYTTGFPEGKLPALVNQYIGVTAAMEILALLASTHAKTTSTSLSLDGTSQAISGPGPELYDTRLKQLASKRQWLKSRLQATFGCLIGIDNV
jgi:hypothetical protein